MARNMAQSFYLDVLYVFGSLFIILYLGVTQNLMDAIYLVVITIIYFRMKFCQWKKYH